MLHKLALGAALGVLVAAAAIAGAPPSPSPKTTSKANAQALCAITHECGYGVSDSSLPSGSQPVVTVDNLADTVAEMQRKIAALADCVYQHRCQYDQYIGQ